MKYTEEIPTVPTPFIGKMYAQTRLKVLDSEHIRLKANQALIDTQNTATGDN